MSIFNKIFKKKEVGGELNVDEYIQKLIIESDVYKTLADENCKRCYGRGYIHYNSTCGHYVPCRCVYRKLKKRYERIVCEEKRD